MDLLKTLLIYMTMVYVSAVQGAPEPPPMPVDTPPPTAIVTTAAPQTQKPTAVPTPDITPNSEYKMLKVGDKGDKVTTMQRRLAELGYYTGDVDGRFGNQTRRAVERFQYYQGLQVDGIAGKSTLTVLYESDKVVHAPMEPPSPTLTSAPTPTLAPVTPPPTSAEETPIPLLKEILTTAPSTEPTAAAGLASPAESSVSPTTEEPLQPALTLMEDTMLYAAETDEPLQAAEGAVLHLAVAQGAEGQDVLYVPMMELLGAKGVMLIPSQTGDQVEYAFMLDETNVYYLTYTLTADAQAAQTRLDKNRGDELYLLEEARLLDGVLYVAADKLYQCLGIACLPDAQTGRHVIYMPGEAIPEGAALPAAESPVPPDEAA